MIAYAPSKNIVSYGASFSFSDREWGESSGGLWVNQLPLLPLGALQRDDRCNGQTFSGFPSFNQIPVGLGSVFALSRIFFDGPTCGLAGAETGV